MSGESEILDELLADVMRRLDRGDGVDRQELVRRHPALAGEISAFFEMTDRLERRVSLLDTAAPREFVDGGTDLPAVLRYFGDYRILEEIARGGMGVVYRALQISLNREVALKLILSGGLASEADVRRFHSEAEAAATLVHPNIVAIHEVGEHEGQHYFSMRLVDGGSLAARREEYREPRSAARLIETVSRAVHFAHQRGILHRDLKPANVLLDRDGVPFVTDFGLAKRFEGDSGLTRTDAIVGTPSYMAPEQASGTSARLTTAADVWGLGAILYELLTGRPPFKGETVLDTLRQVVEDDPPRPRDLHPGLDADLEAIVLRSLEKEPERRYGSAEALAEDLSRWLRGEPIAARRAGALRRAVKWAQRRPGLALLVLALSLTLLSGISGVLWQWRRAERALAASQERVYFGLVSEASRHLATGNVPAAATLLLRCPTERRGFEWRQLWDQTRVDWFSPIAGRVRQLELSADGRILAAATAEGDVAIIEASSGRRIASFSTGPDERIALSSHGRFVVTSGDGDRRPKVREAITGRLLRELPDPKLSGPLSSRALVISDDGNLVAIDRTYRVDVYRGAALLRTINLAEGAIPTPNEAWKKQYASPAEGVEALARAMDEARRRSVTSLAFSVDGSRLAIGTADGVDVHTLGPAVEMRRLPAPAPVALRFSPDGNELVTVGAGAVTRWTLNDASVRKTCPLPTGLVTGAAIGRDALSGVVSVGSQLLTFDLANGLATTPAETSPDRTRTQVGISQIARALAPNRLAVADRGRIFGVRTGFATLPISRGASGAAVLSPDGELLAALEPDGRVSLESATSRNRLAELPATGAADALLLSQGGILVRIGSLNPDGPPPLRAWLQTHDARSGRALAAWQLDAYPDAFDLDRHGKRLLVTSSQEVICFDASTGKAVWRAEDGPAKAVAFSSEGDRVVIASREVVVVREASSGKTLSRVTAEKLGQPPTAVALAGSRLAIGMPLEVLVLDLAGRVAELSIDAPGVQALAFTPDGRRLVGFHHMSLLSIWETTEGQRLASFGTDDPATYRLDFGPAPLPGWLKSPTTLAWSADGNRLSLSASEWTAGAREVVGRLRMWDVPPERK